MTGTKNDKDMTGVLYGGVWGFWGGRCIIITTALTNGVNKSEFAHFKILTTFLVKFQKS